MGKDTIIWFFGAALFYASSLFIAYQVGQDMVKMEFQEKDAERASILKYVNDKNDRLESKNRLLELDILICVSKNPDEKNKHNLKLSNQNKKLSDELEVCKNALNSYSQKYND